jgi:hypothetical protein
MGVGEWSVEMPFKARSINLGWPFSTRLFLRRSSAFSGLDGHSAGPR